jgi:SAM-dependent methyltransferase/uncharacterized protein YbaR (Trm112 family)
MRQRVGSLLVCPLDRTPLELVPFETQHRPLDEAQRAQAAAMGIEVASLELDIEAGVLVNHSRRLAYPILHGVPRMLVFPTGVAAAFERAFGDRVRRELPGYTWPSERPVTGEEDVLRTFSREWLDYEWDNRSYWNLSPEQTFRCMDFMLDLAARPVRHQRVLEVGIGIGGIADHVSRSQVAEVVGIDLSYAVDAARRHFGGNPFLHIVQASVFAPPFAESSFDFVYSQGVIHHTFSTVAAFRRLSRLPRPDGRLYVWVYSDEDERRTWMRRLLMRLEQVVRPICWRLPDRLQTLLLMPFVPLYLLHQGVLAGRGRGGAVPYGLSQALHAARDRFTPRYVHRHSNEEVGGWFREAGFVDIRYVGDRQQPDFVPDAYVCCTGVDGVRQ